MKCRGCLSYSEMGPPIRARSPSGHSVEPRADPTARIRRSSFFNPLALASGNMLRTNVDEWLESAPSLNHWRILLLPRT